MSVRYSPLTPRQKKVLRVVVAHIDLHGFAPTIVEVSEAMGLNHKMASYAYLNALEAKGYVRRTPGVARGLVMLRDEDGNVLRCLGEAA